LTCRVDTIYFDDHFNAYCIEERADSFSVISIDELNYYRPYDKQFSNEMDKKNICSATFPFCVTGAIEDWLSIVNVEPMLCCGCVLYLIQFHLNYNLPVFVFFVNYFTESGEGCTL